MVPSQFKNKPNKNNDRPYTRIFSESKKNSFINDLESTDWNSAVLCHNDANEAYNKFIAILKTCFENNFPLVKLSRSKLKDKLWITTALKASCNTKSKKYKKWILSKNNDDYIDFKQFATTHNKKIKEEKRILF